MSLPTIIAGPCAMESYELMHEVAVHMTQLSGDLGFKYVFKSSFEKANRSSVNSFTGPGIYAGIRLLSRLKDDLGVATTTDIHEPNHAKLLSDVVDIIQIPALLSRQTALIVAAGETQRVVNIKRGQFMAPWKIHLLLEKMRSVSDRELIITERGSFNGYEDLIVDFRTLIESRALGVSSGFDATHSVQRPSSRESDSGGSPEYIPFFASAAAAIGVDYLFFETHPDPSCALSDGACMLPLQEMERVLKQVKAVAEVTQS